MKKLLFVILAGLALFIITGCASGKIAGNTENKEKIISVTGIVEVMEYENCIFAVSENCETRSKVSYYIQEEGSSEETYNLLPDYIGAQITVNGKLLDDRSPWSKIITIEEIK